MVLCKITRVISMTSNSNGYYHNRHSAYSLLNSLFFLVSLLQKHPKATIDREPSKFRTIRPGLERVQKNSRDSRQLRTTRQDLGSTREPHEYSEFRAIRVSYRRIQRNWRYLLEEKDDSKVRPDLDQVRKCKFHAIRVWVL